MVRLNIFLLLILILCALGTVTAQHQARQSFQAIENAEKRREELDIVYDRLQLELNTWANHARVEKIAREQLRMELWNASAQTPPATAAQSSNSSTTNKAKDSKAKDNKDTSNKQKKTEAR